MLGAGGKERAEGSHDSGSHGRRPIPAKGQGLSVWGVSISSFIDRSSATRGAGIEMAASMCETGKVTLNAIDTSGCDA